MKKLGLGQSLVQRGEQRMLLLPAMLQSIEVLQLSSTELQDYVQRALEENEALTVEGPEPTRARTRKEAATGRAETERHDEMLRSQPARAASLSERIEEQLAVADIEPELLPWVRCVITALDGNGYLTAGDDALLALAREAGLSHASGPPTPGELALLARAIGCVQRLEPRGIGGRNAIDALLLQLDPDEPDYALLCTLLEDFAEDIAHNKLPAVARALGIDVERLNGLIDVLRQLCVRPASELSDQSAPSIQPDVVVEACGDGFEVRVEQSGLPPVAIEPGIRALARQRCAEPELKRYLRDKLASARSLIEALEQRRATLLRTAVALFEHQRAFLEHGPGHLAPLRMNELSVELDLATSTISRAVAGKYAQTPWGILPLRSFFQGAGGASQTVARDDVRTVVANLFADENADAPRSDDEMVEALRARGFELARRTIAKYRHELGIPSSYRRRRFV